MVFPKLQPLISNGEQKCYDFLYVRKKHSKEVLNLYKRLTERLSVSNDISDQLCERNKNDSYYI